MAIVVTNIARPAADAMSALAKFSVATIYEAQNRTGLFAPSLRPIYRPTHIAGVAVTCEVPPGDNWMIHVAVEQCQPGDVLVVSPTSPCDDGFLGDLLATSLRARGVVGVIIDGGVRDVAALTEMRFPVWSRVVHAQGTVKATLGNVNTPIVCAGALVHAGDAIVADDDGVVVVRGAEATAVVLQAEAREVNEAVNRAHFQAGALGLDVYAMRERLHQMGLRYVGQADLS